MFGKMFSKTWDLIARSLKLRNLRHDVLASNIANVDTPGYRRKDIPFEKVMRAYLGEEMPLKMTHARHISNSPREVQAQIVEPEEVGTPNNVSLEEEMSKLMENHLLYQATVEALIKEIGLMREAITEGGK
ncbi:flagellar basal body rod protein FlgB [Thermosulfurimonas dismutans]|uniref:Flagellar basal body rod protein FlgB n=1 Tax=Thermosulfurimonas dismutans TaxID=999894 RepID=A0A179D3P5_9BACT|nr:flagellar basal body rod protein FlgB [Thermosulfurimonas dismutans]OAQ20704.1 Flagellar basal-body rod protein FlgB [Thermosulfurimonas dismutans]